MAWPKGRSRKMDKRTQRAVLNRIRKNVPATQIAEYAGISASRVRQIAREIGGAS